MKTERRRVVDSECHCLGRRIGVFHRRVQKLEGMATRLSGSGECIGAGGRVTKSVVLQGKTVRQAQGKEGS